MDMQALEKDVRGFLRLVPPPVVRTVAEVIVGNMELFAKTLIPAFVENIMPHLKAGGLESAAGILEKDEIEELLKGVFGHHMMSIMATGEHPPVEGDEQAKADEEAEQLVSQED